MTGAEIDNTQAIAFAANARKKEIIVQFGIGGF
jgi:hypothetical protein